MIYNELYFGWNRSNEGKIKMEYVIHANVYITIRDQALSNQPKSFPDNENGKAYCEYFCPFLYQHGELICTFFFFRYSCAMHIVHQIHSIFEL